MEDKIFLYSWFNEGGYLQDKHFATILIDAEGCSCEEATSTQIKEELKRLAYQTENDDGITLLTEEVFQEHLQELISRKEEIDMKTKALETRIQHIPGFIKWLFGIK